MYLKLVIVLVLSGLVVLFVVQNAETVQVRYLLWTLEISRALLIFCVLAIGIAVGWLVHGHLDRRRERR